MTSMIERVARALAKDDGYEQYWRDYVEQARVVIAAMREPTQQMLDAYDKYLEFDTSELEARFNWQAMIDAASEEKRSE